MSFYAGAYADYPRRIISAMPSVTEMLFALGLNDQIVGVTTNCNYPPEAGKKEKIGGFSLNLEKIVFLKPDLIVCLEDAQKREIKKLKDFGLPVYVVNPRTVAGVMESLLELGKVAGREKEAAAVVDGMKRRMAAVPPPSASRPKILALVGYDPLVVAGGGTFIDDIIKCAGGENLAGGMKAAYPPYSFEKLMQENPSCLIIPKGLVDEKEIRTGPRWRSLKGRILFMDADVLSRPGPRVAEAVERIAGFIALTQTGPRR